MKIAVVGATGLVGRHMIHILEERGFGEETLVPVASERSAGETIPFGGKEFAVVDVATALETAPDFALFSAGSEVSKTWAKKFSESGTVVIDNSSAWRLGQHTPLIVPEVNGAWLTGKERLIANPNCSTIQLMVALAPVHKSLGIRRMVVTTFQSVSGAGQKGYQQWVDEVQGKEEKTDCFPHPIHGNVIPQCDSFEQEGFTKEEMKLIRECKKILNDYHILIAPTCTRVPVAIGHSESVVVETFRPFDMPELLEIFNKAPGLNLLDKPESMTYPMPLDVAGYDEVFIGRIRRDPTQTHGFHCWIVGDNLRKGAATNAIQIMEIMLDRQKKR